MGATHPEARAAIVVAGGSGRRLGGVAKPWLLVRGRPIIEHVLAALEHRVATVVLVGQPPRDWLIPPDLMVTVEQPPGGGPAAAVRAALPLLQPNTEEVLLVAGDAPHIGDVIAQLLEQPLRADGIALRSDGEVQFLLSRVALAPLRAALEAGGTSMRSVFDHLQIDLLEASVLDADTWEDVVRLRKEGGPVSEHAWLDEVREILGVDATIDVDAVLALARDVAHARERRYAPLTAYLLGYAAAQQQLTPERIAELASKIGAAAAAPEATSGE